MRAFLILIFTMFTMLGMINVAVLAADSEQPIVIGATVSMEGKYIEPSMMIQKGLRLWVNDVNEKGGILGRARDRPALP